jgi:hypothetical protein
MQQVLRSVTAVVIAFILSMTNTAYVVAGSNTAPCQGSYTNRHSGWSDTGPRQGARALFPAQSLSLCTTIEPWTIAGSFAFVNIEGPNSGSGYNIVQIGVGRCRRPLSSDCDGQMRWYWAWGRDSAGYPCGNVLPMPVSVGLWDGTASYYMVTHSGSYWRGYVDGVEKANVPDWFLSCSWSPARATWFTETWNYGDSLGGSATNKFELRHMQYQATKGGAWTFVNADPSSPCSFVPPKETPPFYYDVYASDEVQTWTDR